MRSDDEDVNCGTQLRDAGPGFYPAVPEGAAGSARRSRRWNVSAWASRPQGGGRGCGPERAEGGGAFSVVPEVIKARRRQELCPLPSSALLSGLFSVRYDHAGN